MKLPGTRVRTTHWAATGGAAMKLQRRSATPPRSWRYDCRPEQSGRRSPLPAHKVDESPSQKGATAAQIQGDIVVAPNQVLGEATSVAQSSSPSATWRRRRRR
ncbi:UNVERIFIED_CONTAM: hypothetical protein Sradi_3364000 [Sesamum radiatum]|uniref:Uncharacterized protein n=1 Tax=Sesamum radiatum TaxID=300843 RepID=A0AAW2R3T1_SESRA